VNASVEESFGLTTVESLACGTPVIGYDNTGTREILLGLMSPNLGAMTAPTGDVYAIADAIKTTIETEFVKVVFNNSPHLKRADNNTNIQYPKIPIL
jgi:glycosyltransferase involved in cell wall biosynthesis